PGRTDTAVASRQEDLAAFFQDRFLGGMQDLWMFRATENDLAFPITRGRHIIALLEEAGVSTEQHIDLFFTPDIEATFFAFAVGIQAGGEGPTGRTARAAFGAHLAQHPGHGLSGSLLVKRIAARLPGQREEIEKLRIVVE